jgi:hypothetical protein
MGGVVFCLLHIWAGRAAVRAKHAALACFGFMGCAAPGARIEKLSGIGGDVKRLIMTAHRARKG